MSDLANFLAQFKQTSDAIIDAWFVVDIEQTIVEFNRAFYAMLPRATARGLKGKKSYDVVKLEFAGDDIIQQCISDNTHVRLDEIKGRVAGADEQEMRYILSAMPIRNESGQVIGVLELMRDVTDEAMVQVKYQEMLETEARERDRLSHQIRTRTRELLDTNQALLRIQKELIDHKKGLLL